MAMGEKLLKYYKYVHDLKGLAGSIELAKVTKIPSINAATAPDSEDNVSRFRAAIKTLTGKEAPVY